MSLQNVNTEALLRFKNNIRPRPGALVSLLINVHSVHNLFKKHK